MGNSPKQLVKLIYYIARQLANSERTVLPAYTCTVNTFSTAPNLANSASKPCSDTQTDLFRQKLEKEILHKSISFFPKKKQI